MARKAAAAVISRVRAPLPVKQTRAFSTEDRELNRRLVQLERSQLDVSRRLDGNKADNPLPSDIRTAGCSARFGDYLRCDPSKGAFTVRLPKPSRGDAGKQIYVKNITSSGNAVNLVPIPPAKIGGGASASIASGGGSATIVCDGNDYWIQ